MESDIHKEAYAFACRIIKAAAYLQEQKHEYEISKQLKRSGTSISANIAEAHYAQSRADFKSKMYIALKEANESQDWINMLHDTGYFDDLAYKSIPGDLISIIIKLARIVRNTKL